MDVSCSNPEFELIWTFLKAFLEFSKIFNITLETLQVCQFVEVWAETLSANQIAWSGHVTSHVLVTLFQVLLAIATDLRNEGGGCWTVFGVRFWGFLGENVDVWWCFWGFGVEKRKTVFQVAFMGEIWVILGYLNKSTRKHLVVRAYFSI